MIPGVSVRHSQAAFFIWMDLRAFMPVRATFADEERLCEQIFDRAGVFILRGEVLRCAEPGWFRLVFSMGKTTVDEALERLRHELCKHFEHSKPY